MADLSFFFFLPLNAAMADLYHQSFKSYEIYSFQKKCQISDPIHVYNFNLHFLKQLNSYIDIDIKIPEKDIQ